MRVSPMQRFFTLLLAGLILLGLASSAPAAAVSNPRAGAPLQQPKVLVAGFFDNVVGNRSRMVQFTFIGFAIGVVILMTATRKH